VRGHVRDWATVVGDSGTGPRADQPGDRAEGGRLASTIAADERDVIGLRSKIRNPQEQVYLLRTNMPTQNAKKLFLEYARSIQQIGTLSQFYNTLTTNCTTQILKHFQTFNSNLKYNWKILLSGYVPQILYESKAVDTTQSFDSFMKSSFVNDKANLDILEDDFSFRIRKSLD
jgi:hypothetical protein